MCGILFVYLTFQRVKTDKEVQEILASHILGFHRVKRDRESQKIQEWEDKVPEVARLIAMESKPEAGQMPGFQRSCKDQPKTNSGRSQFRCQQISYGEHWECFVPVTCLSQSNSHSKGKRAKKLDA